MNKKLIFFDIDGTLLDEQSGSVPASTIEAIEKAQKMVIFVLLIPVVLFLQLIRSSLIFLLMAMSVVVEPISNINKKYYFILN